MKTLSSTKMMKVFSAFFCCFYRERERERSICESSGFPIVLSQTLGNCQFVYLRTAQETAKRFFALLIRCPFFKDSVCGSVGRAVASNIIHRQFESSLSPYLFTINCIEKTKRKKSCWEWSFLKMVL